MFHTHTFGAVLLLAAATFGCANASAQKVTVEQVPYIEDAKTMMIATLSGIQYVKTTLRSDFSKKDYITFKCYKCVDGKLEVFEGADPKSALFDFSNNADSVVVEAMLQTVPGSEHVKMVLSLDGFPGNYFFAVPLDYDLPMADIEKDFGMNPRCLLSVELEKEFTVNDEIPIFGITSGASQLEKEDEDGKKHYGFSYCTLSDPDLHPKDWKDIEGVLNYTYYTIQFKKR